MRHFLLILCSLLVFSEFMFCQTDSILEESASENIIFANTKAKEISIDLSNPEDVALTLKRIHTFKYLESVILEGETDESTLKKIMYRFSVLKNLTSITLKDNELKKIPDNIAGIKTLRTLTVEGNSNLDYNDLCIKLSKVPITELNLIDNELKVNPANLSEISSLRKIKITGSNQLDYEALVDQLAKLPGLIGLAIPVNYLTELPKNITKLASLQVLDVSDNILTELPEDVSSLKAINNLAIQGNLLLNPTKDLEKFKGNDIRFLSIDKEISGEDIEQIKKMFPNAEINFPLEIKDEENEDNQHGKALPPPSSTIFTGELKTKKELKILSGAYLSYPALFQGIVYNFDTLGFEERYANLNYSNVYQRLPNGQSMGGYFTFSYIRWGILNMGHKDEKCFGISNSSQSTLLNYPELRAFSGMYWVYQGELSKRKFKKKFQQKLWSDIRIEFDKNNSMFTIQVKSATGFEKFNAYPLTSTNMSLEKTQQDYVRRYLMYQKALSKRSEQFKKNQNKEKKRYDFNFNKMQNYAWKELQLKMSNEERLMSREEWLEYYDNIIANEKKAIDNAPLSKGYLLRQLTLLGFNSFARNLPTNMYGYGSSIVNVDFIDTNGSGKLAVTNIINVDNKNKYFSQMSGTLGLSPSQVFISQFSSYLIFVELRNGNFGVVTSNEIDRQSFQTNKTCQFKVKIFDKNLNTIGDLLKDSGLE